MEVSNKLTPEQCANMADIREEIDLLDRSIIQLIGQRYQYVKSAAKFKTSETTVCAPERFKAMLLQRREWAQEQGLHPDVIEKLYSDLVNYFIQEEMERWKDMNV
ncbi:isochorismate lyase [Cellvibrio sp. OA-2007]|uniref:isochorismate lyase n=1 Tax=Cellvibrio sp. OA-2007 TaxID=529823 RepID=UPI000785E5B9|nr:isochorismate lyase [Cellvibrio sp. OA-2007]